MVIMLEWEEPLRFSQVARDPKIIPDVFGIYVWQIHKFRKSTRLFGLLQTERREICQYYVGKTKRRMEKRQREHLDGDLGDFLRAFYESGHKPFLHVAQLTGNFPPNFEKQALTHAEQALIRELSPEYNLRDKRRFEPTVPFRLVSKGWLPEGVRAESRYNKERFIVGLTAAVHDDDD